ncbi:MAG TPA: nitroreductase [Saprospiraceae bacterium]|nr:nitroreductase [Saprospiraceae bacterium]HPN69533.1 nitroreductase [Saprospiraceae bacterium]
MKRRNFVALEGTTIVATSGIYYLSCNTGLFKRADTRNEVHQNIPVENADEREILFLASRAPSGHNTQPWFVIYVKPYHWIIGNDKSKWLPTVDPTQRETVMSIGAFLQNLEYAAQNAGYVCQFTLLATCNQDEKMMEVHLKKSSDFVTYDIQKIKQRRTLRSNYLNSTLKEEDLIFLTENETDFIHYIPNTSIVNQWLNEQTIVANNLQINRQDAQEELSEWIRFSSKKAQSRADGLSVASMEIDGITAWYLRNFYEKSDVMKAGFKEKSINRVREQVAHSAGWLLITSKDDTVKSLLDTGKRLQRLLLKIKDRNIAIHPMTQIMEEPSTRQLLKTSIVLNDHIQLVLRIGYVAKYPQPVSLRRPLEWFVRT